jgi:carbon-monoxide dehydrogenase large subunit
MACLLTEVALECAARQLGADPVDFRLRNFVPDDAYPVQLLSGTRLEALSHQACLRHLVALMDYPALQQARDQARAAGRLLAERGAHAKLQRGRKPAPAQARSAASATK